MTALARLQEIFTGLDQGYDPKGAASTLCVLRKHWKEYVDGLGKPMAYWFEHPQFGMELSLDQLSERSREHGWTETPLYAHPSSQASEADHGSQLRAHDGGAAT